MAKINNLERYPIKANPTSDDYVIGTDVADNNKTKNFRVSSLTGDGGGLQNNRAKVINFGRAVSDTFDDPSIAQQINLNIAAGLGTTVAEDQFPIFVGIVFTDRGNIARLNKYMLQNYGKGIYGVGGDTVIADSDLELMETTFLTSPSDVNNDPNANVENLGEIGSTALLDVLNAASPAYAITAGTNWYFQFTRSGLTFLYGFKGANGTYGLGQTQFVEDDLFLIYDENNPSGTLQDLNTTTAVGNVSKANIIVSSANELDATDGYFVNKDSDANVYAFFGLTQKVAGQQEGLIEIPNAAGNHVQLSVQAAMGSDVEIDFPAESGKMIVDAPNNSNTYGRLGEAWVAISVPAFITSGSGYIISGRNEDNYGDVGTNAIDLSFSNIASTTLGATGQGAFATGEGNTASGNWSAVFGRNNTVSQLSAFVTGTANIGSGVAVFVAGANNTASGNSSAALGSNTASQGAYSLAAGRFITAYSLSEIAIGLYGTTYSPAGGTSSVVSGDRLFNVGVGTSDPSRADGFTILKNGNIGVGINNFEAFINPSLFNVNGEARLNNLKLTSNGTYADDTAAGVGGLTAGQVYNTATGELRIKL